MIPWFGAQNVRLYHGDCLDVYRALAARIAAGEELPLDAVVTDPPAGIAFMSRRWDRSNPATHYEPPFPARSKAHLRDIQERHAFVMYWAERFAAAYDCLTPEGIAIVWAIPRTSDWTAEALRLAGFFVRDVITHIQAQGWPKGRHTLRPLAEHWLVATKSPGAVRLDVDAVRVPRGELRSHTGGPGVLFASGGALYKEPTRHTDGGRPGNVIFSHDERCERTGARKVRGSQPRDHTGEQAGAFKIAMGSTVRADKWDGFAVDGTETIPAYRCVAGCETCGSTWLAESGGPAPRCECGEPGGWCCPMAEVDAQGGHSVSTDRPRNNSAGSQGYGGSSSDSVGYGHADEGGPSRFFSQTPPFRFVGKCGPSERHFGCEELYWRANRDNPFGFDQVTREQWEVTPDATNPDVIVSATRKQAQTRAQGNVHPTVKPLGLCLHLLKLTGARRVGDLCAGSGAFAIAAWMRGVEWVGAGFCVEACVITRARLTAWQACTPQAVAAFMAGDEMPKAVETEKRQGRLFDD